MDRKVSTYYDFGILYVYSYAALKNTFHFSRSWLTVTMAGSRYFAIYKPLQARYIISLKFTWISTSVVFFFAILVNLPRFLFFDFDFTDEGYLFMNEAFLLTNRKAFLTYHWVAFITSVVLPFFFLLTFNILLVITLMQSIKLQSTIRANTGRGGARGAQRITAIFVVIIIFYFVSIIPAEINTFLRIVAVSSGDPFKQTVYNITAAALELVQMLNFSFNFLLYTTANSSFRLKLLQIICCKLRNESHSSLSMLQRPTNMTSLRQQRDMEPSESEQQISMCK